PGSRHHWIRRATDDLDGRVGTRRRQGARVPLEAAAGPGVGEGNDEGAAPRGLGHGNQWDVRTVATRGTRTTTVDGSSRSLVSARSFWGPGRKLRNIRRMR